MQTQAQRRSPCNPLGCPTAKSSCIDKQRPNIALSPVLVEAFGTHREGSIVEIPFSQARSYSLERLGHLLKVTQLEEADRALIQTI